MATHRASPGASVSEVAELLRRAPDVTLFAHVNPDADALGSALALGIALRRAGATVRVAFGAPEQPPSSLRALDVQGLVVPISEVPAVPSTLVVLDTGSVDRLGRLGDRVEATIAAGGDVVVVDHHASNTWFGTHHLIDDRAEATVVIALALLDELGVELEADLAACLYAGLVTDTRSFRHATATTHLVAARLISAGVDPLTSIRPLMDSHPFAWLSMLSEVLADARLEKDAAQGFGLAYAVVGFSYVEQVRIEETESVIEMVRTAHEADVAAVLKETAPNHWSVSLRSDGALDVGVVAERLGGGGHRAASGFTATAVAEEILADLRVALNEAPLR